MLFLSGSSPQENARLNRAVGKAGEIGGRDRTGNKNAGHVVKDAVFRRLLLIFGDWIDPVGRKNGIVGHVGRFVGIVFVKDGF